MALVSEGILAASLATAGAFALQLLRPDMRRVLVVAFGGLAGTLLVALPSAAAVLSGNAMTAFWLLPPLIALVGVAWTRRFLLAGALIAAGSSALTVFVVTIVIGLVSAPILTFDSWRFLEYGSSLFGDGHSIQGLQPLFATYPLLMTSLQGLARALGLPFAAHGLAAPAIVAIGGAVAMVVRRRRFGPGQLFVAMTAAVIVVASSSYLLRVQLGYVNSHALAAGFMTVAVASVFAPTGSIGHGSEEPERTRQWLVAGACCGLAMSRVEGMLIVALILACALGARTWPRRSLVVLSVGVGLPAVWYLGLAAMGASGDILSPSRMAIVVAAAAAPLALRAVMGDRLSHEWIPALALIGLALAAVLVMLTRPDGFTETVRATMLNLAVDGLWGGLWWVLLPLAAFALASLRTGFSAWFLITYG